MGFNGPYNSPEAFGLEIIEVLDAPDLSYEFDMLVVWKSFTGDFLWGQDSG